MAFTYSTSNPSFFGLLDGPGSAVRRRDSDRWRAREWTLEREREGVAAMPRVWKAMVHQRGRGGVEVASRLFLPPSSFVFIPTSFFPFLSSLYFPLLSLFLLPLFLYHLLVNV